jgi:N-methylhydantoinase A/oxoprolinase/acetone carboxylase beta subunit
LVVRKVLSVQPGSADDPAVRARGEVLVAAGELALSSELPGCGLISEVRLGTTVATNAL